MVHLSAFDRHLARRFSGGLTPELARQVKKAGGGRNWLIAQLTPAKVEDPQGDEVDTWFPSLKRSAQQIFDRQNDDVQGAWEVMADLNRWTVARRISSSRQLVEVMVDFWSNLLNVSAADDESWFWRVDYDRTIRRLALSSFDELLHATIPHPAMGLYLDNATSTKEAPNENLGRELLELHTVGVDAGYTEDDVKASSRLLTGYRVDVWWPRFQAFYWKAAHYTGPIQVLDFHHPNADRDGRAAVAAYLTYLASHPATARRLAHRLCVRFVSDQPSEAIVSAVAKAYLDNRTAIGPTLLALVDHPDFAASAGQKIRTPTEDYVATVRALGIRLHEPTGEESFVNAMYWQYGELGNAPYEWPAPNGYPEAGAAWTSAGRLLGSLNLHISLADRWWPSHGATWRKTKDWLPELPPTLDAVVDHIGRKLLGQPVPAATRQGVATALGHSPNRRMHKRDLNSWTVSTILASLLDSPTHLHR